MTKIDRSWTLFLDRDGTINRQETGKYVNRWEDFQFLPGTLEAIRVFKGLFGRVFIVTNQQGIARGFLTEDILREIHDRMMLTIMLHGGNIHKIYHCPDLDGSPCRKPAPGMALQAQVDYPEISFNRSIVIGDNAETDAAFARNAGIPYFFQVTETHSLLDIAKMLEKGF